MKLSELKALVAAVESKQKFDEDPHILFHELDTRDQRTMTIDPSINLTANLVTQPHRAKHGEPLAHGDFIFNIVPFTER